MLEEESELSVRQLNEAARQQFDRWLASRNSSGAHDVQEFQERVDVAIGKVLSLFLRSGPSEREGISASIDTYGRKALLGFGAREAARGIREGSSQIVRDGLLAIAVEGGQEDFRVSVIAMAMLYHSLNKLNTDADGIFREIAGCGSKKASSLIANFADRDPKDRSLSLFNITERDDPSCGFTYESLPSLR